MYLISHKMVVKVDSAVRYVDWRGVALRLVSGKERDVSLIKGIDKDEVVEGCEPLPR